MYRQLLLVAFAVSTVGACGEPGPAAGQSAAVPDSSVVIDTAPAVSDLGASPAAGGFGDPVRGAGEFERTSPKPISGAVQLLDNGCWMFEINGEARLVAFPEGFVTPAGDPSTLIGPDGLTVGDGTRLDVQGEVISVASIPGGADSRYGDLAAHCVPGAVEMVVLDRVEPYFDPTELTPSEIDTMVADATFSESWPCGYGFAASSADQRVGLVLYTAEDIAGPRAFTLPDTLWTAEVVIGKDLFVQNCDDAVEQWESNAVFAARLPLIAGAFDVDVRQDLAQGCGSAQVTSRLTGIIVDGSAGGLALDPIALTNDAWGCFAG